MSWYVLRKHLHVSWLIAVVSMAITIGVILAAHGVGTADSIWLFVAVILLIVGFWRRSVYFLPLIVIGGVLIGMWRGSAVPTEVMVYKNLQGHMATLTGKISEDPDVGKHGELLIRLENISVDGHEMPGKVWVSGQTKLAIKRSDIVTIKGTLQEGFGSFAATMYRVELVKAQRPQPGDVALQVRDWFADAVRRAIDEPAASLGLGYLLGQRRALPPELADALVVAGLTHVVVASGYNLTILVRFARRLFDKVSKYLATLVSGGMIVAFIMITGMSPSMSRAGLVAGLALAAWYYGRKFHPLILLPFAAAVTLLVNPGYSKGDLGWQLSFAAFAGVMILAPLLQAYFYGSKKPGNIRQILGETISAQIVTLPILVLAFGQFSNVAVIANILVLPLVPLAMLLTFIAGIGAVLFPALAWVWGQPAEWLLNYMVYVAQYVAALPWAQTEIEVTAWHVAFAYAVIVGVTIYLWRATKYNLRDASIID